MLNVRKLRLSSDWERIGTFREQIDKLEEMIEISTECQKTSFVKRLGTNRHFSGANGLIIKFELFLWI